MSNDITALPMGDVNELQKLLDNLVEYDPNQIHDIALDYLTKVTNNELNVLDTTTPFSALLGLNTSIVASAMNKTERVNRVSLLNASNYAELNKFINYNDVKETLALPATITFTLQVRVGSMVRNNVYNYKIPKDSVIRDEIHDYKYLIPHDIYIIRNRHTDIITVQYGDSYEYDNSLDDKIITTISNFNNGDEYIEFNITLEQLDIIVMDQSITAGNIDMVADYNDQLYSVDIYLTDDQGNKKQVPALYTLDQITDVGNVAYIIDNPDTNKVNIGVHSGLINRTVNEDQLEVVIKTTRGAIKVDYEDFSIDDFSLDFRTEIEGNIEIHVFSNDYTIGGRNRLSFEDLHQRVIEGRMGRSTPLTENNLITVMKDNGLIADKNMLNLSGRSYLASPEANIYSEFIGDSVLANMGVSKFKLDLSKLSEHSDIIVHPGVIHLNKHINFFINRNNELRLATNDENTTIQYGGDNLTQILNDHKAFYTPLYYMLYTTNNGTSVKAFTMDNPVIYKNRYVYTAYDNSGIKVIGREITAVDNNGYKLQITISACKPDQFDLYLKLSDSSGSKYKLQDVTGSLEEVERTYEVMIKTDKTVMLNDKLVVENVLNDHGMNTTGYMDLEGLFDIVIVDKLSTVYTDDQGMFLISDNLGSRIVSKTTMSYVLGKHLKWLWVDSSLSPIEPIYDIVEEDVPLLYSTVVLDDADVDITDCSVDFPILHNIGDPVLDDQGNPVYKYKEGDKRLDESGNPIVLGYTGLQQHLTIAVLDLAYRYSNFDIDTQVIKPLEDHCTDKFDRFNERLLGDTVINYTPRGQIGDLNVTVNVDTEYRLPRQPISVTVYIPRRNKPTDSLLETLKKNIIKYTYLELSKQNVNLTSIGEKARKGFEDIVSTINVLPIVSTNNDNIIVYRNSSIANKLQPLNTIKVLADGKYEVTPNIDIYINYI